MGCAVKQTILECSLCCWESKLNPLEEQIVLLSVDLALLSLSKYVLKIYLFFFIYMSLPFLLLLSSSSSSSFLFVCLCICTTCV